MLVNGSWSTFDGSGAVNCPVPKFCKIELLKAFWSQRSMETYVKNEFSSLPLCPLVLRAIALLFLHACTFWETELQRPFWWNLCWSEFNLRTMSNVLTKRVGKDSKHDGHSWTRATYLHSPLSLFSLSLSQQQHERSRAKVASQCLQNKRSLTVDFGRH